VPPQPGSERRVYPGSVGAMIMGIIAVCFCWFSVIPLAGFIFFIPSLILGIVAMKRGGKFGKVVNQQPEAYTPVSKVFLTVAKITGLISTIAAPIMLLLGLLILASEETHMFDF
jgi:hypothetical protein